MIFGGRYKFRPSAILFILLGLLIFMPTVFIYLWGFIITLILVPLGLLWLTGRRWIKQTQARATTSAKTVHQTQSTKQQRNARSTIIDCDDYQVVDETKPDQKS